jgi:hypothetical protein
MLKPNPEGATNLKNQIVFLGNAYDLGDLLKACSTCPKIYVKPEELHDVQLEEPDELNGATDAVGFTRKLADETLTFKGDIQLIAATSPMVYQWHEKYIVLSGQNSVKEALTNKNGPQGFKCTLVTKMSLKKARALLVPNVPEETRYERPASQGGYQGNRPHWGSRGPQSQTRQ